MSKVWNQMVYERNAKIYFKISWIMLLLSSFLLGLSYLFVKILFPAPTFVIAFTTIYLYFHAIHFLYGGFQFLRFFFVIKRKNPDLRVWRFGLGMLFSPISFLLLYIAIFLFALSSCANS